MRDHNISGAACSGRALISGITGQDGSYLAEHLLKHGYEVHGIRRPSSTYSTARLEHLREFSEDYTKGLVLHYGDLTDSSSLDKIISTVQPDEVYNLGALSHVHLSFAHPELVANIDGLGTLRLLESLRRHNSGARFYQASTSELFGNAASFPINEQTPFSPRSPYAIAKLYSFFITKNYREAYGLFAANGILFNHESPRRGASFVTRKIARGLVARLGGVSGPLTLGNLDAIRDWGHARDYVRAMHLMLSAPVPKDYVIATGHDYSVREFLVAALNVLGVEFERVGAGTAERYVYSGNSSGSQGLMAEARIKLARGEDIVRVSSRYFRPTEVNRLVGDASIARAELGWYPEVSFSDLVLEMMLSETESLNRFPLPY